MRPFRGQPEADLTNQLNADFAAAVRTRAATAKASDYTVLQWMQRRGRRVVIRVYTDNKLGILDGVQQAAREFRAEEKGNSGVHPLCEISAEATLEIAITCLLDPRPQAGHEARVGARWFQAGVPDGVRRFFREQVEARYRSVSDFETAGYLANPPLKRLIRHKVTGIISEVRAALEVAPRRWS